MTETASKSNHKRRRYPSLNCCNIDEKVRFGIWRSAVAPSDAAEQNRKLCVQQNYSSSRAQQPQRYFGKFTSCTAFGPPKLVRSELFLDYLYEFW